MDKVGMFKVFVTKRKYNSSTCMSKTLFASHCSEKKMSGRKLDRAGVEVPLSVTLQVLNSALIQTQNTKE